MKVPWSGCSEIDTVEDIDEGKVALCVRRKHTLIIGLKQKAFSLIVCYKRSNCSQENRSPRLSPLPRSLQHCLLEAPCRYQYSTMFIHPDPALQVWNIHQQIQLVYGIYNYYPGYLIRAKECFEREPTLFATRRFSITFVISVIICPCLDYFHDIFFFPSFFFLFSKNNLGQ